MSVQEARAGEARRVVSLDGTWEIADGKDDAPPGAFDRRARVPGLVDLARPPFEEVGTDKSPRRRASFWYRRRFRVAGEIPAVALLKLHKVKYGCTVFLNGGRIGENRRHFTPGWFDVRAHLKGKDVENELLVRVGGHREHPGGSPVNGWDFEKKRYIPGIYDSVELILTGSPHIVNVRTAPDLKKGALRVRVELAHAGERPAGTRLRFEVREAATSRAAGRLDSDVVAVPPAGRSIEQSYPPHRVHALASKEAEGANPPERCTVDATIPIRDARPWTPEDPFLYRLEVDAGSDVCAARFGLREFHFDPQTKRPMLNGRPYYLRGTNICILRFFDDPVRGSRPWDRDWVRRVIRGFRKMNWNSCRYCIGFPPEIWYDIADEEGLLVQDEFPIWLLGRNTPASKQFHERVRPGALAAEYADWMFERRNHPCVFMWDAQNESRTELTGAALGMVRGLDLQGRDWDNGWARPQRPTDTKEEHPYFFTKWRRAGGTLSAFGRQKPLRRGNPVINNEYGWLWLNRDGTLCTLPKGHRSYAKLLPPGVEPTAEVYRRVHARTLAAMTEKFRADRTCAGVMHFCGLGYSRPDGETSDDYVELDGPTFEPHFVTYVRDAFAPTGIMLDLWEPRLSPGQAFEAPVVIVNDRAEAWRGRVRARLMRPGALVRPTSGPAPTGAGEDSVLQAKERPATVPAAGRVETKLALTAPEEPGRYLAVAELVRGGEEPVRSWRDVVVADPGIAVGRPVKASSVVTVDGKTYPAGSAVDDRSDTRWSSEFSDPQWIAVDLGEERRISRVVIEWEGAHAKAYAVQVSSDGRSWRTVHETGDGKGGVEEIRFEAALARWVRVYGKKRATQYGYSIWNLAVYEGSSPADSGEAPRP